MLLLKDMKINLSLSKHFVTKSIKLFFKNSKIFQLCKTSSTFQSSREFCLLSWITSRLEVFALQPLSIKQIQFFVEKCKNIAALSKPVSKYNERSLQLKHRYNLLTGHRHFHEDLNCMNLRQQNLGDGDFLNLNNLGLRQIVTTIVF